MPELRLLRLVAPHLPRIMWAALLATVAQLSGIALIATAAWLLASAAEQPPLTSLTVAIVAVRAFAIGRGVARYLERLSGHDAVLRALADIRGEIFSSLTPLAPAGNAVFRNGDLLSRLVSDVDKIQDLILRVWIPALTALLVAAAVVCFTFMYSVAAAGVLLLAVVLSGVVLPLLCGRFAASFDAEISAERGAFAAATADLVQGAQDLAAYGASDEAKRRAYGHARAAADAQKRGGRMESLAVLANSLIAGAGVIGVYLAAPDLGVMTVVLALTALATFETTGPLPQAARQRVEAGASLARVLDLLRAPAAVADPREPAPLPEPPYHLCVENARLAIPGRAEMGVGLDLDLPPGKRVAIVGASGAGKSMLLNMLVRFIGIESGRVTLSGEDVTRLRGDDVRGVIGGMLGDAHVFNGTVSDNLAIGAPGADEDRMRLALAAVGLTDVQLWTRVGADAQDLSGGQRQRLLMARALLASHPIMVLDEPTEHVDPATAASIVLDTLRLTRGHSLIMVTHRFDCLDMFDEVLVMDQGRVIQRGTHDELLEVDGQYRRLFEVSKVC